MQPRHLVQAAIVSTAISTGVGFAFGQATAPDIATAARSAAKSEMAEIREQVGEVKHLAKHNGRVLMRLERRVGETPKEARALTQELELARFDIQKARDLSYFACSNTGDPDPCTAITNRPAPLP